FTVGETRAACPQEIGKPFAYFIPTMEERQQAGESPFEYIFK
ncbi:hypothetical protein HKBW3S44_01773, partial [Candidatus Hakubella thermalkaliphila]